MSIHLRQVSFPRLKQQALTVRMQTGEHWALLGPNGCGKTTLLHTLAGLLPYSGSISLPSGNLQALNPLQRAHALSLLLQDTGQRNTWTVQEYLQVAGRPLGKPRTQEEYSKELLQALELQQLLHHRLDHLSGGQWQRVQIAAVLMQNSPIMLLDEPLNHLDLRHQQQVMQLLEHRRLQGHLVISSLHDINQAFGRCTHALLFYPESIQAGVAADCIVANKLSQLYGLPLQMLEAQGRQWLLPADLPAGQKAADHCDDT